MRDHLLILERGTRYLLRGGVVLCGVVIATGWLLSFRESTDSDALTALLQGEEIKGMVWIPSLREFPSLLLAMDSNAIIVAGIVLLISLPVLRVALVSLVFLIQRDYIFSFFSLIVLSLLLVGLMGNHIL